MQNSPVFSCADGAPWTGTSYEGTTDNNSLTRYESINGMMNEWLTVELPSAVDISTIFLLSSNYESMTTNELHPYYQANYDPLSPLYDPSTAAFLSVNVAYFDIYTGTNSAFLTNSQCDANGLGDGAYSCTTTSSRFVTIYYVAKQDPNGYPYTMISEWRLYSEREIGRFVTSVVIQAGGSWMNEPLNTLGKTTVINHMYFEAILTPAAGAGAYADFTFAASTSNTIRSVLFFSRYAQQIKIEVWKLGALVATCSTATGTTATNSGTNFLEFDCANAIGDVVRATNLNGSTLRIRKIAIFGQEGAVVTNSPPTFATEPSASLAIVKTQTLTPWSYALPTIVDVDNDAVTATAAVGSASFVSLASNTLTVADISASAVIVGTYSVTVTLSDAVSSTSYTIALVISDPCLDSGISPIAIPDLSAHVNKIQGTHSFSRVTTCGPATFTLVQIAEPWITFTLVADTWTITVGSLSNADAGTHSVTLQTALDRYPTVSVGDSTFTVTIALNAAPVFVDTVPTQLSVVKPQTATPWSYTLPATSDAEGDVITASASLGTASSFLVFTAADRKLTIADISAIAVVVGSYNIVVSVSDATGQTSYTIAMVVSDPCLDNGISPIAIPNLSAQVNKIQGTHSFSRVTTCGPATFTLVQIAEPWITFTLVADTWTITVGSLSNADAGTHPVTLQTALDRYPTVSVGDSTFTVTIALNAAPVFVDTVPTQLSVVKPQTATPWSYTLPATSDAEGDVITASAILGTASSFLVFTAADRKLTIADISATAVVVGSYNIVVSLSDATGQTSYTIPMVVSDPCLDNGIKPRTIPDLTAQVVAGPAVYEFSPLTECGKAQYTLVGALTWLMVTQTASSVLIEARPMSNSAVGYYSIALRTTLDQYPTVAVVDTVFQVTVVRNVNSPPTFAEQLGIFHIVLKTLAPQAWVYKLPNVVDADNDPVSVTFDAGTANFVTFSSNSLQIADVSSPDLRGGTYQVTITLDDTVVQVPFKISINVKEPIVAQAPASTTVSATTSSPTASPAAATTATPETTKKEAEKTIDKASAPTTSSAGGDPSQPETTSNSSAANSTTEQQVAQGSQKEFDWQTAFAELERKRQKAAEESATQYVPPSPPKASIRSIDESGLLTISFSEDMRASEDFVNSLSKLKTKDGLPAFTFKVVSGAFSDQAKLGYSWKVVTFGKRSLELQITFENPIYISMEEEPEFAEVTIKQASIFISEAGLPLDMSQVKPQSRRLAPAVEEPLVLRKKIPKQKDAGDSAKLAAAALESAASGSKAALMGNFALNLALSASLNQLWSMINTQQLFVLLPLMKVTLPENAQTFFQSIFQIAAFDFYDTNDLLHSLLDIPETEPYNESFEELGFESRYVLNNMGTMIFFYLAFPLLALLQKILFFFRKSCNCAMNTARKLRRTLYYSWILTMVFESYSLIAICCLIAYPVLSFSSWGLAVQACVCIGFTVTFLTVPFFLMRRLAKQSKLLDEKRFSKRYGSLYEDLKINKGGLVFLQPTFFLVRRIILAVTVVSVEYLIVQVYLVVAQSLAALFIAEFVLPFKNPSQRKMEIFNEVILILLLYTMICFTPWIPEVETKVDIGYMSCFLVALHFVVNLALMLGGSVKGAIKNCKLRLAKKQHAKDRVLLKNALDSSRAKRKTKRRQMTMLYLQMLKGEVRSEASQSDLAYSLGEDSSVGGDQLYAIQEMSQESSISQRSDPFVLSIPHPQGSLDQGPRQQSRPQQTSNLKPNHGLETKLAHRTDKFVNEEMKDNYETLMRELALVSSIPDDSSIEEEEPISRQQRLDIDELERQAESILGVNQDSQRSVVQHPSQLNRKDSAQQNKISPYHDDEVDTILVDFALESLNRRRKRMNVQQVGTKGELSLQQPADIVSPAAHYDSEESEVQFDLV